MELPVYSSQERRSRTIVNCNFGIGVRLRSLSCGSDRSEVCSSTIDCCTFDMAGRVRKRVKEKGAEIASSRTSGIPYHGALQLSSVLNSSQVSWYHSGTNIVSKMDLHMWKWLLSFHEDDLLRNGESGGHEPWKQERGCGDQLLDLFKLVSIRWPTPEANPESDNVGEVSEPCVLVSCTMSYFILVHSHGLKPWRSSSRLSAYP